MGVCVQVGGTSGSILVIFVAFVSVYGTFVTNAGLGSEIKRGRVCGLTIMVMSRPTCHRFEDQPYFPATSSAASDSIPSTFFHVSVNCSGKWYHMFPRTLPATSTKKSSRCRGRSRVMTPRSPTLTTGTWSCWWSGPAPPSSKSPTMMLRSFMSKLIMPVSVRCAAPAASRGTNSSCVGASMLSAGSKPAGAHWSG